MTVSFATGLRYCLTTRLTRPSPWSYCEHKTWIHTSLNNVCIPGPYPCSLFQGIVLSCFQKISLSLSPGQHLNTVRAPAPRSSLTMCNAPPRPAFPTAAFCASGGGSVQQPRRLQQTPFRQELSNRTARTLSDRLPSGSNLYRRAVVSNWVQANKGDVSVFATVPSGCPSRGTS